MTKKQCHKCGKTINDIMFWDNGEWCYCLDCSNKIIQELYGEQQMTEKRFFINCSGYICDMDMANTLTLFEVIDIMNNLHKENKELKNKLHFVMKRLNEKDKLLAKVLEVNKNLEKKNK